jgi:hypothetical protein
MRCPLGVSGNSKHCDQHRLGAQKLYSAYKKASDKAEQFNIDSSSNINYLTKAYHWLNEAYGARMKHRQQHIVPECYDEGHDTQFKIIKQKLDQCEAKLFKLYAGQVKNESNEENKSRSDEDNSGSPMSEDPKKPTNISQKIRKCQHQRNQTETNWNTFLDKYIQENKIIEENKARMANLVKKNILPMIRNNTEALAVFCGAVYHIIRELYKICYFEKDWEPRKCDCGKCDNYPIYRVGIFCACSHCNSEDFFLNVPEDNLKKVYELLLFQKTRIQPAVNSLLYLYHFYEDNIMNLEYEMTYDPSLKAMVLEPTEIEEEIPRSELMALDRLKEKVYFKKIERDYDLVSTSDDSSYDD